MTSCDVFRHYSMSHIEFIFFYITITKNEVRNIRQETINITHNITILLYYYCVSLDEEGPYHYLQHMGEDYFIAVKKN